MHSLDAIALREHLNHCASARSRWHPWRGRVEAVDAFVLPRVVTSLTALLLAALALMWWLG